MCGCEAKQKVSVPLSLRVVRQRRPFSLQPPIRNEQYYTTPLWRVLVTPRESNPNCLVIDYVVDSPPGRLSAVSLQLVPAVDCNCSTKQPFEIIFTVQCRKVTQR